MKKKILITIIAMFAVVGLAHNQAQAQSRVNFMNIAMEQAQDLACENNLYILVYVQSKHSTACKYMDLNIFSKEVVWSYLNDNFVNVSLNGDILTGLKTIRSLGMAFYPTVAVLDYNGDEIGRIEGASETPNDFLLALDEILENAARYQGWLEAQEQLQKLEAMEKEYKRLQKEAKKREKAK